MEYDVDEKKEAIHLCHHYDTAGRALRRLFVAAGDAVADAEGADFGGRSWGRTQPSKDVLSPVSGRPMMSEISSYPPPSSIGTETGKSGSSFD